MARDEVYVIDSVSGARAAVPRKHFNDVLKADGWVIDPDGPSAADEDTRTVRAAEQKLERAAAKRETEAEE